MTEVIPEPAAPVSRARRGYRWLFHQGESWLAVALLAAMTLLSTLEPLGRKLFHAGVPGGPVYVQVMTLWMGFVGALLATGQNKHLALSTELLIPKGAPRAAAVVYSHTVAATVCMLFAYSTAGLINADRLGGTTLEGGLPKWWSEFVMPVALIFIALRFAWKASPKLRWRLVAAVPVALVVLFAALVAVNAAHGPTPTILPGIVNLKLPVLPVAIALVVGMLLGTPIFVSLAGLAMIFFHGEGTSISAVPVETLRLIESSTLPAIPLLTAAGFVLAEGGASQRLVRVAKAIFGWFPGGMAVMVVVVCALFTTFTGASGVTILALGGLVLPLLVKEKYPEGFSLGLVTASGSLGLLFPPSLPVILYSLVAKVDMTQLFLAGLVPGALTLLLVIAWGVRAGYKAKATIQKFDSKELAQSAWEAKWELALPVVVVAGFATGFFTLVESAAVACAAAVVVECFVFRDIPVTTKLPSVAADAGTLVGSVLILLGVALGLTSYLVDAEIPDALTAWVTLHIHSQVVFLLVLNALLLVLGSVLEIYSAIFILAPLVAPIGARFGVEPLHLGIVFLANLELGFLLPPLGLNLFLSSLRFGKPLPTLYKEALPFLIIGAIGVLLITYFPAMTTGVVALLSHPSP